MFNVEQIPAESMSHRLARADKVLFGEELVPYNIYSNQIVPLWNTSISLWDKMKVTGSYLKHLTGGGIDHENTGEHITSKQAEKIIGYAVECDLEHFAITGTFCQCTEGHVIIGKRDACAKCGFPIKSKIARVVGFFTPVEDWNLNKQIYDHDKRREFTNGDFDYDNISKVQ
jgi:ribonucleoside-triphosphate reductase